MWKRFMGLVLAGMLVCPAWAAEIDVYARAETHMDTVPEGWIGVYTAEDLHGIRWNLDGNYILMNDIDIPDALYEEGGLFADGFMPIGKKGYAGIWNDPDGKSLQKTKSGAFTGIFDGNGYEISNLHITSPNGNSTGLFGACETEYSMVDYSRWETTFLDNGTYIREDKSGLDYRYTVIPTGGVIRNLGITDSSVNITVDHTSFEGINSVKYNIKGAYDSLYAGMIAGYADALVDCYIHDVEIRVEMTGEYDAPFAGNVIAVGGLVGKAILADRCAASEVKVDMVNHCAYTDMQLYVGGVYGVCQNATGIQYAGTVNGSAGKSGVVQGIPVFLPGAVMEELCWRVLCREYGMSFDRDALTGMTPREMQNYAIAQTGLKVSYLSGYLIDCWRLIRHDDLGMHPCYRTAENTETGYMLDAPLSKQYSMEKLVTRVFTAEEWKTLCQKHGIPAGGLGSIEEQTAVQAAQSGSNLPIRRRRG